MHLESSKLLVDEFARLVLPFGTTAVVADPHEIANVLGTDGVHWLLDVCGRIPLDVWFMASSCVPASRFESPRRELTTGDLDALLRRRRVIGLAEMMNFPGVIGGDPHELEKLALAQHVDGHAPGVLGRDLNAYVAAGIRSDHEAYTAEEGRERLRAGMWLLIREASAARNLAGAAAAARRVRPEPDRVLHRRPRAGAHRRRRAHQRDGARRGRVRDPAGGRARLRDAQPGVWHGLSHLGAIAPGYQADLLLLPDLERFVPDVVLKAGAPVAEIPRAEVPGLGEAHGARRRARPGDVPHPVAGRPRARDRPRPRPDRDRVARRGADHRAGEAVADPTRDLAKIAVIERHLGTGPDRPRASCAASGCGAARSPRRSRTTPTTSSSSARATRRWRSRCAGSRTSAAGSSSSTAPRCVAELPLPVAGLLSDAPLDEVVARSRALVAAARELGCTVEAPFQLLAFLALSVIPSLKLTDRGLVDVDRFELVPLEAA